MSFDRTPITAVCGKRGSGKTLLMTWLLQYYAQRDGLPVYSNYTLRIPNVNTQKMSKEFLKTFFETKGEAFLKVKGGLIGIDEFPLFLDAYDFQTKAAKVFSYFTLQTRKRNVSLFMTAQQFSLIPKRIRDNVDIILYPHYDGKKTLVYDIYEYNKPSIDYKKTMVIPDITVVFPWYDTEELIEVLRDDV